MSKNYTSLISELREKLKECKSPHDIANIKAYYLGKSGVVTNEFSKLKDASLEEIKRAFRQKALLRHPDHGGDKLMFYQIMSAKKVLSDPQLRVIYDRNGEQGLIEHRKM